MTDAATTDSDHHDRGAARDRYETVISRIRHNTGGYQPPLVSQSSIVGALCGGPAGDAPDDVRNAITKACTEGDLFRWTAPDGTRYLGLDDVDELRDRIASHATHRDEPNRDLIGIATQRTQHLRDQAGSSESDTDHDHEPDQ